MTKKQKGLLSSYLNGRYSSVSDAYNNPSETKKAIERHILESMLFLDGHGYKVCGKNCFHFSCGFQYVNEKDNRLHLMYFTHANTFDFPID